MTLGLFFLGWVYEGKRARRVGLWRRKARRRLKKKKDRGKRGQEWVSELARQRNIRQKEMYRTNGLTDERKKIQKKKVLKKKASAEAIVGEKNENEYYKNCY